MSKEERHGFRDQRYSEVHRTLRSDLYFIDIDAVEVNEEGKPIALLELKHGSIGIKNAIPTYEWRLSTQTKLANMAGLPVYLVLYYPPLPKGYDPIIHDRKSPGYDYQSAKELDWSDSYSPINDPKDWKFEVVKLNIHGKILNTRKWVKMNLEQYERFLVDLRTV